jgi:pimeloyl-ACP methyl ester carboxylesterase
MFRFLSFRADTRTWRDASGEQPACAGRSLAEVHGGFVYSQGPADKDGADIFAAAVGYTPQATYWRVDWNTLANADVPIAEWTFATGSAAPTAGEAWPANAKLRSSGIQYALVVSAQHAQLLEVASGKPVPGAELKTEVNIQARSFIVRIPTSVLPVSASWQVRLAAGLANSAGRWKANSVVAAAKPATSRWSSAATSGWRTTRRTRLLRATSPSTRSPSTGRSSPPASRHRNPYAVYVPSSYKPSKPKPAPLTWILHSLGSNLNQYGGLAPSQLEEECQDRASICATTEGFSDGQWYFEAAQVDFWDVWHQLAADYDLNPDATVISGYSMGGFASYKLALEYPDLFAQAMPLEGPVVCGERIVEGVETAAGSGGECEKDGNTTPLVANAKWVPYVMTYGALDELVPFTGGLEQVEAFEKLSYRYYAVLYPAEDHLVFATQNDFAPATSQLGQLERVQDPASFTFSWYPDLDSGTLGIGPSSDYWLSGLRARSATPGQLATVSAASAAIREPQEAIEHHTGTANGPTPAVTDSLTWTPGARPKARQAVALDLTNVAALTLETLATKLKCGTVTVTSDGASTLTLEQLQPESSVTENGSPLATASAAGDATVSLATGTSTLQLCT